MRISDWSSDVCSSDLSWLGNRAPIILSERGYVGIGLAAQQRRRTDAIREIGVAIIAQLLRSDRCHASDENQFLLGQKLHDLTGSQKLARGFLAADHDMSKPRRDRKRPRELQSLMRT